MKHMLPSTRILILCLVVIGHSQVLIKNSAKQDVMIITNDAMVGIGTTNPRAALTVQPALAATPALVLNNSSGYYSARIQSDRYQNFNGEGYLAFSTYMPPVSGQSLQETTINQEIWIETMRIRPRAVGIGTTGPENLLSVGRGNGFGVDNNGDLAKINGLGYQSWPTKHANGFLLNDGNGTLTWEPYTAPMQYWQRLNTTLSPIIQTDNIGVGTTAATHKMDLRGAMRQTTNSSYDVWIQGGSSTSPGSTRNLALLGQNQEAGDKLFLNYNGEYANGTQISSNLDITGNLGLIRNVKYAWPTTNAIGVLNNDGDGNLTWTSYTEPMQHWQRLNTTVSPRVTSDNVGIGTTSATHKMDLRGAMRQTASTAYDVWIQGGSSASAGTARNLALLGQDEDSGDKLFINYNNEYANGTQISSNLDITGNLAHIRNVSYTWPSANTGGVLNNDGSGTLSWSPVVKGSGVATQVAFWSGNAGASSSTLTSESQLFWDAANNRLGIGTSTPGYGLQVMNSRPNDWVAKISNTASNGSVVSLAGQNNGLAVDMISTSGYALQIGRPGSVYTPYLYISGEDGKVGIGTTNINLQGQPHLTVQDRNGYGELQLRDLDAASFVQNWNFDIHSYAHEINDVNSGYLAIFTHSSINSTFYLVNNGTAVMNEWLEGSLVIGGELATKSFSERLNIAGRIQFSDKADPPAPSYGMVIYTNGTDLFCKNSSGVVRTIADY